MPALAQAFLERNRLKLIIRSHEGPDARDARDDMPPMAQGFTIDHDTPSARRKHCTTVADARSSGGLA
jgi:serine/threonine-protein phosphatase 5